MNASSAHTRDHVSQHTIFYMQLRTTHNVTETTRDTCGQICTVDVIKINTTVHSTRANHATSHSCCCSSHACSFHRHSSTTLTCNKTTGISIGRFCSAVSQLDLRVTPFCIHDGSSNFSINKCSIHFSDKNLSTTSCCVHASSPCACLGHYQTLRDERALIFDKCKAATHCDLDIASFHSCQSCTAAKTVYTNATTVARNVTGESGVPHY